MIQLIIDEQTYTVKQAADIFIEEYEKVNILAVPEGDKRCISGKKSINVPASRLIGKMMDVLFLLSREEEKS